MRKKQTTLLNNTELSAFCTQVAAILAAGISPQEGMEIMLEDTTRKEETGILTGIRDSLLSLGVFSAALEDADVFPEYMLQMVRLGEQAGRLDEVMASLADHYEREAAIASSVRSAVTYPSIMIGMMLVVVVVLITRVLPIFNQVFAQFGQQMSGVSGTLLGLGGAMNRYALVFLACAVILAVFLVFLTKTKPGRRIGGALLLKLKFTRSFYHKNAASRFASGMALSLKSGMTTEAGIEMSAALTGNPDFLKRVETLQDLIQDGTGLAEALQKAGIFSGIHSRMVTVAGKTGNLDDAMDQIAASYANEIDESIGRAISILEPTLVAALSLIVGLILLSVMMPLLGILAGI